LNILIVVQQDATHSSLFIIVQVHSTCFGCQTHPSSGVHKTVTTASGTGYIFCATTSLQRGQVSLATLEGGNCSTGVHKTVNTASGTGHIFCAAICLQSGQASLANLERYSCSTGGCSYSFVYL